MKRSLLFFLLSILISVQTWSQCSNIDSDNDGVLDCIDPCPTQPTSIIGNLSFEHDFTGWYIPQNSANFNIQNSVASLHGSNQLYITAPNGSNFQDYVIYTEEFSLNEGVNYNFSIPVKRIGNVDGEAIRWALIDENGIYRHLSNYYNISEEWTYISFTNFQVNFNNYSSNKFRLRLEFGLSSTDMVVDKIEFYESSLNGDPTYLDNDGDGNPDCETLDFSNHPDYNALVSIYNSLNGANWIESTNWLDTTKPISTWYGITETNGRVTGINLGSQNNVQGIIPNELTSLTELESLWIQQANLSGEIPSNIGNLTKLRQLILYYTYNLSGSIPESLANCLNLELVYLTQNNLSGKIPDLTGLTSLTNFYVDSNNFQFGDFEAEFNNYQNNISDFTYAPQKTVGYYQESVLDVGSTATLNTSISGTQNIYNWYRVNADGTEGGYITSDSSFTVTINSQDDYKWYYYYTATNSIVTNLTLQSSYFHFQPAPSSSPDYDDLVAFYNSTNGDSWTNNSNWLDNTKPLNSWHGLSVQNNRVVAMNIGGNNLTGSIPNSIQNLTELTELSLWGNLLTGNIPPEIGNLVNLETLWLNQNGLTGSIPDSFQNLINLKQLYLIGASSNPEQSSTYSGDFPDLTALPLEELDIRFNYFNFTNLADDFEYYKANIPFFSYSPQYTLDQPIETEANFGDNVTLTITDVPTTAKNMQSKTQLATNSYQWYKDDVVITGANSSSYTITNAQASDSGVYFCEITNADLPDLIIKRQNITLNIGTLSSSTENEKRLSVYPNPATNWLHIKLPDNNSAKAKLLDISGKELLDINLLTDINLVDISTFSKGIYLLQITSKNKTTTKRIIKQ